MSRWKAFFNLLYAQLIAPIIILVFLIFSALIIDSKSILLNLYLIYDMILIVILVLLNGKYLKKQYKVFANKFNFLEYSLHVIIGYVLMIILIIFIAYFLIEPVDSENEEAVNELINGSFFLLAFINIVFFTPVKEEIVYRASMFHLIAGKNIGKAKKGLKIFAAIVIVLYFAFIHVDSEFLAGDFFHLISVSYFYVLLSALITFFYIKYEYNVFAAIGVHILNNFNAMIPIVIIIFALLFAIFQALVIGVV